MMDYLENRGSLREKVGEHLSKEIPAKLSWEHMGASISQEVENRKTKKKNRFWLLLLLLLLSGIGVSLAIHKNYLLNDDSNQTINLVSSADTFPDPTPLEKSSEGKSPIEIPEPTLTKHSKVLFQQTNEQQFLSPIILPTTNKIKEFAERRSFPDIKSIRTNLLITVLDSPKTIPPSFKKQIEDWVPEARWQLEFAGGSNMFSHTFKNASPQNFNEYLPGWQASVRLKKNMRKDLHLITGFQWTELRFVSRFQEDKEVNFYRPNTIDTIINRVPSGNQEIIYRDSLPGIRSRNFQHYNSHRILSIPLLIGYEKKLGGLKLGVQSGMQLNLLKQHNGRSLIKADEVWELGDERIYRNRLGISYLLEAQLDWKIRPDNSIFLRASWDQNLDNWISEEISLKARPSILQISFGFSQAL